MTEPHPADSAPGSDRIQAGFPGAGAAFVGYTPTAPKAALQSRGRSASRRSIIAVRKWRRAHHRTC